MSMDVICPSCGYRNPPGAEDCEACNFPLKPVAAPAGSAAEPMRADATSVAGAPAYEPPHRVLRRPHRRGAPMQGQSVWLWLFFGTICAAVLIWTAIEANRQRSVPAPVEGSSQEQQKLADAARAALAADSSNIDAHERLANVLYDTGNWEEAIVHYRAVLRRDSTRVPPMVDLGVCYYNLGHTTEATRQFERALALDPKQPIALFNLGTVNERHGSTAKALEYYRLALENAPTDELRKAISTALERAQEKAPPPATGG